MLGAWSCWSVRRARARRACNEKNNVCLCARACGCVCVIFVRVAVQADDVDLSAIADACPPSYTGADCYGFCANALLRAVKRRCDSMQDRVEAGDPYAGAADDDNGGGGLGGGRDGDGDDGDHEPLTLQALLVRGYNTHSLTQWLTVHRRLHRLPVHMHVVRTDTHMHAVYYRACVLPSNTINRWLSIRAW